MTHTMPDTRLIVIALLLLGLNVFLVVMFCRGCYCDQCNRRYAIWMRFDLQLCRQCKAEQDRHTRRIVRRRSVLQRIFRTAA